MDPMDITDDSFRKKKELKDELPNMESTVISSAGIIQPHQDDVPSKVKLIIHHQFPGVELTSPVYAGDGVTCYQSLDQRLDVSSTTQVSLNIDSTQDESIGILMYKLQSKNTEQMDKDEATYIQLIIVWKVHKVFSLY
jgi:hypothetical protein